MKALTPDSLTQTVRSLRLRRSAVPTFRPQPRDPPDGRFEYQSPQRHQLFQASPLMSRLATRSRRNRFVILRTAGSPPVALHPASRRRSYLQFLGLRPSQARTSTVQTKRPHGTHSWPGSYGGFLVKRIVSDGSSFSGVSVGHVGHCVQHAGRPLWSDLSVCKLVSGGTICSVPCCPIRGAGGVWRGGTNLDGGISQP